MTRDLPRLLSVVCLGAHALVATFACEPRAALNNDPSPAVTCDTVEQRRGELCPDVSVPCENTATAECIIGMEKAAFDSLCRIERTGAVCHGSAISPDYERWCALQFCQGMDFDECLNSGLTQCAASPSCGSAPATCVDTPSGPANNPEYDTWCASACVSDPIACRAAANCQPPVGDLCDQIEALVGTCPAYGYDCPIRPRTEAECLLSMWQDLEDPCIVFQRLRPIARCGVGSLSAYGDAMCQMEACLETGLTWSYEECNVTYGAICGFVIP